MNMTEQFEPVDHSALGIGPRVEHAESAQWIGDTLLLTEWRGEPEAKPVTAKFAKVDPRGDAFCYWCAFDGECFALAPEDAGQSCIRQVEVALQATKRCGSRSAYVIWQPKRHGDSEWARWVKKWTKRTQEGTV